ncbi:MAG TPA: TVP38/TMEM64 family protein [Deltaproteobacteria bacterium]|nr:TVP38/TMEM64 family protein [Deltaproteobacteria bacterium]
MSSTERSAWACGDSRGEARDSAQWGRGAGAGPLKLLASTAAVGAALAVALNLPGLDAASVRAFVERQGAVAPLVFIGLCAVKPLLFFVPSLGLTVVAGALFGPLMGTLYVALGGMASTVVGFYAARIVLREAVTKHLGRKALVRRMDERWREKGFSTTLMLRLMNIPWDLVSYAAGLSPVRFRDFYLASLAALGPVSFVFTYFGHSVTMMRGYSLLYATAAVAALGALPHVVKRLSKPQAAANSHDKRRR